MSPQAALFISNAIQYMLWCVAVNILCENRYSRRLTLLLEAVSFFPYYFVCASLQLFSILRLGAGLAVFIICMLLLHKGKRLFVFLVSLQVFITMIISEMLYVAVMPREAALSGALFEQNVVLVYAGYLFLNAVLLSMTVILLRFGLRRIYRTPLNRSWLLLPVFPACQFVTLAIYFNIYSEIGKFSGTILWLMLIYVIADIVLFWTIHTVTQNAELTVRNKVLAEQIDAQAAYYTQLAGNYEQIRKMRHDIDNHLYTMQALLEDGEIEEATRYTREVTGQDSPRERFPGCLNMVVAAYLEKKAEELEQQGVVFTADVRMPAQLTVSNPDLICIFGNLLDNAQEACKASADRTISLSGVYQAPYLNIICRNPVPEGAAPVKARRIPELGRGIGMTILSQLAERYDGRFSTAEDGKTFTAEIILKGETA